MKLRIERDILAEAVTWVARALPARPPVAVLSGIMVETTDDNTVKLSGFDYETSRTIDIPATVTTAGKVLVSGRLLADISRSLPGKPVDLVAEDARVRVTCGGSKFGLLTMPIEDYPHVPTLPPATGTVAGDVFAQAVAQVSIAAGRDERMAATQPLLTGIDVQATADQLTMVATDRYRLAVSTVPWRPVSADPDTVLTALVPARTLSDMSKALGAVGEVTLSLGQPGSDLVGCHAAGRTTTSMMLDGKYPNVMSLFPESTRVHCVTQTQEFIDAVRRVAVVAERESKVHLTFTDDAITLEAGMGEDAQASELISARTDGESITATYNPHYLLDGLSGLTTAYTRMSFTEANKAAVITGQAEDNGDEDQSYRYLLMPMRQ